jgi:5-methyltetrahydrofolate--homocysteine methyltransferase
MATRGQFRHQGPPRPLIEAYRTHVRHDRLSGLLVKSAQQMVVTAQDLKTAGVSCPFLLVELHSRVLL